MLEDPHSTSFAAGAAVLALLLILTFPSLSAIASHFREPKTKVEIYKDKDGVATEHSMAAFSAKAPKTLLSIFTLLGLASSLALAVLGTLNRAHDFTFLQNWISVGQWVSTRDQG